MKKIRYITIAILGVWSMERAFAQLPVEADKYLDRGVQYYQEGNFDKAIEV